MDLDEAVALLAGTTLIQDGTQLGEARAVVLAGLERLRAMEKRVHEGMQTAPSPPARVLMHYLLTGERT